MQNQIASMPPAMTPPQMGELLAMSVIFGAITLRVPTRLESRDRQRELRNRARTAESLRLD